MSTPRFHRRSRQRARDSGNAVILSLFLLTLLLGLATAQVSVNNKNIQSANYFLRRAELRKYADGGIDLAVHDLKNSISGYDGKIGTVAWTTANDLGADGVTGTADYGEGDGIPTIGEPNLTNVSIGPTNEAIRLLVHVADTATANVSRIVATATDNTASATVEAYARSTPSTIPRVGAVYVDPAVALDLKGNSFLIDGNDRNPDGTAGPDAAMPGITTFEGATPGVNQAALLAQIGAKQQDQVQGLGGAPSLGEDNSFNLDTLVSDFQSRATHSLPTGTYSNPSIGNASTDDYRITYVSGDIHLTGTGQGAGVLVVDGNVTITGQFDFQGLIIVTGDIRLSGGGASVHVWGSTMINQSITMTDPDLTVSGNAQLYYSSQALSNVEAALPSSYTVLYYNER